MTRQRSFKRLVRLRMNKTGESYTTARAMILGAASMPRATSEPDDSSDNAPLPAPDATIRARTGRGWEEWFAVLDDWGAAQRSHRDIARWVAAQLGVVPLAWNAQTVAAGYERGRLGKAVGEHDDGFAVNVSRTAPVPVDVLFDAVTAASAGQGWLPSGGVTVRTATRPKSARYDAPDATRIAITFTATSDMKSTVSLAHSRLPDADAAAEMRSWWRTRLNALVADLAGGGDKA